MKKIKLIGAAAVCAALGFAAASCSTTSEKIQKMEDKALLKETAELIKERQRASKEKIAKYTSDGWEIDGTSKSAKLAIMEYYKALRENPGKRELVINTTCETKVSRNVCKNSALNNAMNEYAQEARSHVMGRVASENGDVGQQSLESFYAAYERLVERTIEGELQFQFAFYRDNGGRREYDAFYLIDEESASKKRIAAMEQAAKESEAAQKMGTKISDFVREGFRTDKIGAGK